MYAGRVGSGVINSGNSSAGCSCDSCAGGGRHNGSDGSTGGSRHNGSGWNTAGDRHNGSDGNAAGGRRNGSGGRYGRHIGTDFFAADERESEGGFKAEPFCS